MNHFSAVSIVTPTALYVQICRAKMTPVRKQTRIKRGDIAPEAISTEMRSMGRHCPQLQEGTLSSYPGHARERVGTGVAYARTGTGI